MSRDNLLWLTLEDGLATLGAQFREVAVGLLITALNPSSASYAWYFLAGSVPGLLMPRLYAWASLRWAARRVMQASYVLRILLVLVLWRTESFGLALAALGGLALGSGLHGTAQAHYIAQPDDYEKTRSFVQRLRQSQSLMRLAGPLAAGAVLNLAGFRFGFLASAALYGLSMTMVSRLSPLPRVSQTAPQSIASMWRRWPDTAGWVVMGMSFLTWQANTLAIAYTFHVLHRHAFGYGLSLAVWGGSGFLAAALLARIRQRPYRWIPLLFGMLGLTWLGLAQGVSFPIFVALGGVEGLAGWLVQDLVQAVVLSMAEAGRAGEAKARLGVYNEIGSLFGIALLLFLPATWLVMPWYGILGGAGLLIAIVASLSMLRRPQQGWTARQG